MEPVPPYIIQQALNLAFAEDWGPIGDITSRACVKPNIQVRAQLQLRGSLAQNTQKAQNAPNTAQSDYVVAGLQLAKAAFLYDYSGLQVKLWQNDGDVVKAGTVLADISGSAQCLLNRERVALNYLCHLSGIASMTYKYVQAVEKTGCAKTRIVDTRKTTPGLRALEKFAVRCSGGQNHRFGLFDAMMIKDNHIAAAGGIAAALRLARQKAGHTVFVELEVDTLEQLYQINFDDKYLRPDCVLLDNMSLGDMQAAVHYVDGRVLCEASGLVQLEQVAQIAQTGVDLISVGALTHSAPNIDIGLDIVK